MSVTMKSLGLDRLSRAERILLVEELWDSIAMENGASLLSEEQKADLRRRLDAFQDNPKAGRPWSEVRDRLRNDSP
jgi:putative addiction module component (TIGR02574 family)